MKTVQDLDLAITTDDINEVLKSSRTPRQLNEGKISAKRLLTVRAVIGDIFKAKGLFNEWKSAVIANGLLNSDIVSEKFGANAYAGEWKALHKAVQDAFRNAGRTDLADTFVQSVPVYTEAFHPVDFIATLLHGSTHPISRNAAKNAYSVLEPFKEVMTVSLLNKGMGAPPSMDNLTQVFYNTFVANSQDGPQAMNFDTMTPGEVYNAEDDVIKAVATYLKSLADKKEAGVPLSSTEQRLADATVKVSNTLTEQARNSIEEKVGEKVLNTTTVVIAIVIGALLIYSFTK